MCSSLSASVLVHDAEISSFLILFLLFVVAVELNQVDCLNAWEVAFMVYSLGFSLEKVAAMQEHGIRGNVFHALAVRHLLKLSLVFFTGTWVCGDCTPHRGFANDCLEWV